MNQRKQEAIQSLREIEKSSSRWQWVSIAWAAGAGFFVIMHSLAVASGEEAFHAAMLVVWSVLMALWVVLFYEERSNHRRARETRREWERLP